MSHFEGEWLETIVGLQTQADLVAQRAATPLPVSPPHLESTTPDEESPSPATPGMRQQEI